MYFRLSLFCVRRGGVGVSEKYFTTNMMANFLILIIPPLPGCVAYMVANEMITETGASSSLLTVFIGVGVLLLLFPLTFRVTEYIRKVTK